jgi:diguanylate cyclase (GGDEF)-like protein
MLRKLLKGTSGNRSSVDQWTSVDWLSERASVMQTILSVASALAHGQTPQESFEAMVGRFMTASSQIRLSWYWLGEVDSTRIAPTMACGPAAAYAPSLQFDLKLEEALSAELRRLLRNSAAAALHTDLHPHAICPLTIDAYGLAEMLVLPLKLPDNAQQGLLVLHATNSGYFQRVGLEAFIALTHYFEVALQVAHLRRMIESTANADPLTSLLNRRGMQMKLTQVHAQYSSARSGTPRGSYLLFVDVDYFKQVNDYYGRDVGDRLIVEISQILGSSLRGDDLLSRWGGEEFVVVLSNQPEDVARQVAERLRLAVASKPFKVGTEDLQITCSIGVAAMANDVASTEQWLTLAENAAQRAKSQGANRVTWA